MSYTLSVVDNNSRLEIEKDGDLFRSYDTSNISMHGTEVNGAIYLIITSPNEQIGLPLLEISTPSYPDAAGYLEWFESFVGTTPTDGNASEGTVLNILNTIRTTDTLASFKINKEILKTFNVSHSFTASNSDKIVSTLTEAGNYQVSLFPSTFLPLQISSTSVVDTATSGIRTLRITGLTASGVTSENVNLDGKTAVTTTNSFKEIYSILPPDNSDATKDNQGDIYFSYDGTVNVDGTHTNARFVIPKGDGKYTPTVFYVDPNETCILENIILDTTHSIRLEIYSIYNTNRIVRLFSGIFKEGLHNIPNIASLSDSSLKHAIYFKSSSLYSSETANFTLNLTANIYN